MVLTNKTQIFGAQTSRCDAKVQNRYTWRCIVS